MFGVVYVHAWTGLDGGRLTLADSSTQGVFRWVLMELLGRSAVPLLGMISGWLVAGSASHRTYGAFIGGKTRTILLPMLLRSEEHTSELQSLMRTSYAVFCLKQKNNK